MLKGGLSIIKETIGMINPSEINAARYIMEHPEEMLGMTVSELAKASGSSPAAVVRLCKSLGLESYQELKLRVAGDLHDQQIHGGNEYQEISPTSDIETLIHSVSKNNIFSINETLRILNPSKIKEATNLLCEARRIDFYGSGASQLVAQDAQHKFMRINKSCSAYPDSHLQLTSAVTLSERDVAVAFSNSGETIQVIDCIKAAKEQGAKTIAITKYGSNPLGQLCDVHIETLSTESDSRSAATSSRIVQLTILDILYVAVAGHSYEDSVDYLNRSRNRIEQIYRMK
ncbi:MurR/RpiR family transcriptional regulator [Pullulanibacillus sp. KACC 23026]|uniref:MurR/RpiR family transcriptional regulator n=1 Tax=Pullulanibacillus sp. KACC 23026 TaxID=3028315 RepID=UPI0023AF316C|nr:MurR/RpiR family transcriptional regulator [Pullulanibacillus sp. KACC 23026]WEG14731.1 MurR/RpiR family transcriptional regulator [Pullulanibacillus sp. KACC 23026]